MWEAFGVRQADDHTFSQGRAQRKIGLNEPRYRAAQTARRSGETSCE